MAEQEGNPERVAAFLNNVAEVDVGWQKWILSEETVVKELANSLEQLVPGEPEKIIGWGGIFKDLKRQRVRSFLDDNSVELGWQATIMENEAIWTALADSINQLDKLEVEFLPERNEVLAPFKYAPRSMVKKVIIRNYPIPFKFATGPTFSFPEGTVLPPCNPEWRKRNDVLTSPTSPDENKTSGCYITLEDEGVLLLSAALTYTNGADQQLTIHQEIWQEFLKKVLEVSANEGWTMLSYLVDWADKSGCCCS